MLTYKAMGASCNGEKEHSQVCLDLFQGSKLSFDHLEELDVSRAECVVRGGWGYDRASELFFLSLSISGPQFPVPTQTTQYTQQ